MWRMASHALPFWRRGDIYGASPAPHPGAITRFNKITRASVGADKSALGGYSAIQVKKLKLIIARLHPTKMCWERGLQPCNNSADGRAGDQLRIECHYDREDLTGTIYPRLDWKS